MSKSINISYRQVGDYKIPNIILPPEQANITIGKFSRICKDNFLLFFTAKLYKLHFSTYLNLKSYILQYQS